MLHRRSWGREMLFCGFMIVILFIAITWCFLFMWLNWNWNATNALVMKEPDFFSQPKIIPKQIIPNALVLKNELYSPQLTFDSQNELVTKLKENTTNLLENDYSSQYVPEIPIGFKMDKSFDFRPINWDNFKTPEVYSVWRLNKLQNLKNLPSIDFWSDKLKTYDYIGHLVPTMSILFKSNIDGSLTTDQAEELRHLLTSYDYPNYGPLVLKPTHYSGGISIHIINRYNATQIEEIFNDMHATMYINDTEGWKQYRKQYSYYTGYYSVPRVFVMEGMNNFFEARAYTVFGRLYAIDLKQGVLGDWYGIDTITRDGKCECYSEWSEDSNEDQSQEELIYTNPVSAERWEECEQEYCDEILKSINLKQFVKMVDDLAFSIGMDFVRLDFFVLEKERYVFNELEIISGSSTRMPVEILYQLWQQVTDQHFTTLPVPRRTQHFTTLTQNNLE